MVITDNKKIAKGLEDLKYVPISKISDYENNEEIIAVACSRTFAKKIQEIHFPNLKFIQLLSAGFEGVDMDFYKKKGIMVANAANVYSVGMAEFVVYAILKAAKRYNASICNHCIRFQRNYKYITELSGKKVLILGVGGIGSEVAKRLKAFDMTVYGYARRTRVETDFDQIVCSRQELLSFFGECDYIVSTLPDNEETENLINKELLYCINKDVTLVNVGRRKVFNEDNLYDFLKSHKKVTAILDMFERFPNPITNRFRRLSNVWVLPGVTAISQEIDEKLCRLVKQNVEAVINEKQPVNIVNQ